MWRECSPEGRPLTSSLILTPCGASLRTAVPTFWPCASLISTVTGLAAALRDSWTTGLKQRRATHKAAANVFIVFLGYGVYCVDAGPRTVRCIYHKRRDGPGETRCSQ